MKVKRKAIVFSAVLLLIFVMFLISMFPPTLASIEGPLPPFYFSTSTRDTNKLNGSVNGYALAAGQILNVTWVGFAAGRGTTSMRFYLLNSAQIGGWEWVPSTGQEQTNSGYLMKLDLWRMNVSYTVISDDTYYVILVCEGNYAAPNKPQIFVTSYVANVFSPPSVSIAPGSVSMDEGQSQLFSSTVSGGTSPYSYSWYLCTAISGNTIVNPGFETGNFNGWNQEGPNTAVIRSDEHHSGSYSCASQYSGSAYLQFKVTQKLSDVPSDFVTNVSCWCKWGTSADWLRVNYTDGSVSSIGLSNAGIWTQVTLNLAANKTADSLILERSAYNDTIVCIDDVEFNTHCTLVSGAINPTWTFTPSSLGSYDVYLQVTDNAGFIENSNIANVTVNPVPFVAILPYPSVVMDLSQSQFFNSTVSNGTSPYSYQWYLNGAQINGATSSSWVFAPQSQGSYMQIYVQVTDSVGVQAISNTTTVNVNNPPFTSISPSSAIFEVGQSQTFNSTVSGGTLPYTYQWYLNGSPVSGAISDSWTFTPTNNGTYTIYLDVTDSVGVIASSNTTTANVNNPPFASILPSSVVMDVGQSQTFNSTVSGGTLPYAYRWCLNGSAVPGATLSSWTFTPTLAGSYTIYANVTDSVGVQVTSNTATVTVELHDVAVTNVTSSKTVVGQGFGANITVTVANLGSTQETFNLTLYATIFLVQQNIITQVASQNVTLESGNYANITFVMNTTGYPYGNYTLSAYALPVSGETNTANNNCSSGWIIISLIGDITGPNGLPDGKVDMRDIAAIARSFGGTPVHINWNPNADINNDGIVNMKDIALVARNFGQHYP